MNISEFFWVGVKLYFGGDIVFVCLIISKKSFKRKSEKVKYLGIKIIKFEIYINEYIISIWGFLRF